MTDEPVERAPLPDPVLITAEQVQRVTDGAVEEADLVGATLLAVALRCPWQLSVSREDEVDTEYFALGDLAVERVTTEEGYVLQALDRDGLGDHVINGLLGEGGDDANLGATSPIELSDDLAAWFRTMTAPDLGALFSLLDQLPDDAALALTGLTQHLHLRRLSPGLALTYADVTVLRCGAYGTWVVSAEIDPAVPTVSAVPTLQRMPETRLRRLLHRFVDDLAEPDADQGITLLTPYEDLEALGNDPVDDDLGDDAALLAED